MSKPPPVRYRGMSWSVQNVSLRKRGSLQIRVDNRPLGMTSVGKEKSRLTPELRNKTPA